MRIEHIKKFRLIQATIYSLAGIKTLWREESAFRLEMMMGLILLPLIFLITAEPLFKLILGLLFLLLLAVEALNSAVEAVVDRVSLEPHPQSKMAKDMASAAVALVILMNVLAWVVVLYHSAL
jgi:diacylglycerol kinase (ATP)